jgi:hypothetical protein
MEAARCDAALLYPLRKSALVDTDARNNAGMRDQCVMLSAL